MVFTFALILPASAWGLWAPGDASFVNTWLTLGTFENRQGAGMTSDLIGEATVRPRAGMSGAGKMWRYFDDRVFSRNYDDYQDLFSYFFVKQDEPREGRLAYLHTYVWSAMHQTAELRVGAHQELAVSFNGEQVVSAPPTRPPAGPLTHRLPLIPGTELRQKDAIKRKITLRIGWNRLLVKVGNRREGPLGVYARISDVNGDAIEGLVFSANGPAETLAVTTPELPTAWRDWPYVSFQVPGIELLERRVSELARFSYAWPQATEFRLNAEGEHPPFRWSLAQGELPDGLALSADGRITGCVGRFARIGEYPLVLRVTDMKGAAAEKELVLTVRENPSHGFEQSRLIALVHRPERMKPEWYGELAKLMKRQGYGYVTPISYGNGDTLFRWPVRFGKRSSAADVIPGLKKAFDAEGVRFGMYIGQFDYIPASFTYDDVILVLEDTIKKYQPACFFLDWVGTPQHYPDTDAWYSMIRSYDPECVLIVNADRLPQNGDWDIPCIEGSGSHWDRWPGEHRRFLYPMLADWPKAYTWESWRTVSTSPAEGDWKEHLRSIVSLIGEGFIADFDHTVRTSAAWAASAGVAAAPDAFGDNATVRVHRQIADWANPGGRPSLVPSYTQVDPGPLKAAGWGYNLISADRTNIYLHMLENPRGKTGLTSADKMTVGPLDASLVARVVWMNENQELSYSGGNDEITIDLGDVTEDPVDTVIKIELRQPIDERAVPRLPPMAVTGDIGPKQVPGNLAWRKPARLLSLDGSHELHPSGEVNFASLAVDGDPRSKAQGGGEWAWTLEVDLGDVVTVARLRVLFGANYPTDYAVRLSVDSQEWQQIHRGAGAANQEFQHSFAPSQARYVRVLGHAPDGPGQQGGQMSVAEVEVYEK